MKELTILKTKSLLKKGALPRMFYDSKSEENKDLIKGVLTMDVSTEILSKGEQVLIIDNPNNLSKKEFLEMFNIPDLEDIIISKVNDFVLNCGKYVSYSDYELELKNKHKANIKKSIAKKLIKDNKVLTEEQINQLCEITGYPEGSNIDRIDFLEYCLFCCPNGKLYEYFNQFKDPNVRWKDFKVSNSKKVNRSISLDNILLKSNEQVSDSKDKHSNLHFRQGNRHTSSNITEKLYYR